MEKLLEEFANMVAKKVSEKLLESALDSKSKSQVETIFLSTKEASKYFGKHINTIRKWIREGYLPSKKIGNSLYVIIKEEKNEN